MFSFQLGRFAEAEAEYQAARRLSRWYIPRTSTSPTCIALRDVSADAVRRGLDAAPERHFSASCAGTLAGPGPDGASRRSPSSSVLRPLGQDSARFAYAW